MKNHLGVTLAILTLFFGAGTNVFAANQWEYTRLIEIQDPPQKPIAVELDGKVFDSAREDLADLRVSGDHVEIPYMLASQPQIQNRVRAASKVISRETLPTETVIVLDLEEQGPYNEMNLVPKKNNFFRKITVEGSSDNSSWNIIRKGMIVYDLHFQERVSYLSQFTHETYEGYSLGRYSSQNLSFEFPEVAYRYLKVTVPHDEDKEPVELDDVQVFKTKKIQALERSYPGALIKTEVKPDAKSVDIIVDLGGKNLPIDRVEVGSPNENFARRIEIQSSNDMKEWRAEGNGTLFSVSVDGSHSFNKTVKFSETKARYLKLEVYHGNNKPIKISKVTAFGLKRYAVFIPNGKDKYSLSYGNSQASSPSYDIGEILRNKNVSDLILTHLSEETKNNDFVPSKDDKPWTEGHPYLLWAAMGVVILGLIGLATQVVKKIDEK